MKQSGKFQTERNKEYLKKLRIYPTFLYNHLDAWLKVMSMQGWHIVHCGWFTFWFEKGDPEEKEYFTYGLSTQEGKYSISLRYPLLEKTFASKKSKINNNKIKKYEIIEIDAKVMISQKSAYQEMINDRNHLYFKYFVRNACVVVLVIAFALLCKLAFFRS